MEALITALAPAFAVGLALQALVEGFDWIFDSLAEQLKDIKPGKAKDDEEKAKRRKAGLIRTVSIIGGVLLAALLQLKVLAALGGVPKGLEFVDTIVAGLVISLGTDGINQIIKFVEKAKDNQETSSKK